jgi:hypothetical protein
VDPARLFDSQVMLPGNAGYSAHAARNTPAYTSPGTEPPAIHNINPTAMMQRQTRMNGYRFPALSLYHATTTASTEAVMYIGTVNNCAVELLYPKARIIDGRKSEMP